MVENRPLLTFFTHLILVIGVALVAARQAVTHRQGRRRDAFFMNRDPTGNYQLNTPRPAKKSVTSS